jgi:prepilin-type N-terminal cleavage/methylation domain-containing protein
MYMEEKKTGGFTLLELLIVISIIAILSVALVLVLNPAEALKKSRDAQRISDLSTMKTALGLYMTSTSTPYLGGLTSNAGCKTTPTSAWLTANGNGSIYYSLPTGTGTVAPLTLDGTTVVTTFAKNVATPALVDGNGWIPANFDSLTGGSPISNLPLDPTNTITSLTAVASTDLVYRYACSQTPLAFEMDAALESTAYTITDDKRASDGGNSNSYYEVGTNLKIMGFTPTTVNF